MKTDMKIGILVGVVIVAILLIFFVQRDGSQSGQPIVTVPSVPAQPKPQPPAPTPEPEVTLPVQPPVEVTVEPQPKPEVILPVRSEPVERQPLPTPIPTPQPEPIRQPRYHTIVEGDSLSTISQTYYGSGRFWTEIQKANSQRIQNPNHLQVGWKLRIPYPDEIAKNP